MECVRVCSGCESGNMAYMQADAEPSARAEFEATVCSLEGLRIQAVDYWDIDNFSSEPARWDYGDWHHAVMGVQLMTDAGPRTVTWTNRFHPYGVEILADPIEHHLDLGAGGPERIGPDGASRWNEFLDIPVRKAAIWWDRIELGPATLPTGEIVESARGVDVPTALRLDFDSGSVWFVAAIPQPPYMDDVFIPGDVIMIVFSAEKMRTMGYVDPTWTD